MIGLMLIGWKGYQVISIQLTKNWPQTEAKILTLRPYDLRDTDSTSYRFEISYQFTLDGQTYRGEHYFRNRPFSTGIQRNRDERLAELRSQETLTIFYNPGNPSDSFVAITSMEDIWVGLLIGGFFLGVGVIIWLCRNQTFPQYPHLHNPP